MRQSAGNRRERAAGTVVRVDAGGAGQQTCLVVVGIGADENTDLAFAQVMRRNTCPLQGLPGNHQEQALLRIHAARFPWRDPEKVLVEPFHALDQAGMAPGVDRLGQARRRHRHDACRLLEQYFPERLGTVRTRQPASHPQHCHLVSGIRPARGRRTGRRLDFLLEAPRQRLQIRIVEADRGRQFQSHPCLQLALELDQRDRGQAEFEKTPFGIQLVAWHPEYLRQRRADHFPRLRQGDRRARPSLLRRNIGKRCRRLVDRAQGDILGRGTESSLSVEHLHPGMQGLRARRHALRRLEPVGLALPGVGRQFDEASVPLVCLPVRRHTVFVKAGEDSRQLRGSIALALQGAEHPRRFPGAHRQLLDRLRQNRVRPQFDEQACAVLEQSLDSTIEAHHSAGIAHPVGGVGAFALQVSGAAGNPWNFRGTAPSATNGTHRVPASGR